MFYYVNTVQNITYSVNTVQYITVVHYLVHKYCTVNTVQYITVIHYLVRKKCAVLTSVDSKVYCTVHYIVRKYCTVLTSVDSTDMLYRYSYSTHYSRTFCHYYVNTVQY